MLKPCLKKPSFAIIAISLLLLGFDGEHGDWLIGRWQGVFPTKDIIEFRKDGSLETMILPEGEYIYKINRRWRVFLDESVLKLEISYTCDVDTSSAKSVDEKKVKECKQSSRKDVSEIDFDGKSIITLYNQYGVARMKRLK